MQEIALILCCMGIGVLLRLSGRFPDTAPKAFGGWVINVALPAAAIHSVHNLTVRPDWWLAAATPWISVALAIVVLVPLCRALGWSRQRAGALILVAGWGNTSFVGLPMIVALAGKQWLGVGIVIDLFGSYLALSTIGMAVVVAAGAGRFDWGAVIRKIVTFPPFWAIAIALPTNHLDRPEWFSQLVGTLADTLTPLALAAVGYSLRLDHVAGRLGALSVGLMFRLGVAPLAIVLMYLAIGGAGDPVAKVAMLEAAMPPMLGASVIAVDSDLEPDLVALLIGIGVPLSLLTAWGWWELIGVL
ncbi:MAG: AEC family transporter [Mycobacterium sp.]